MANYIDFEQSGYQWTVKPQFAQIFKETVIPLVLSGEGSPQLRVIKRKMARDSFIVSADESSPEIFAKVHKYEKAEERIKTIFRASRARAEWETGEHMLECGLPVAEPLGFGERRSRGLVTGCMLLQRAIPNNIRLNAYLARECSHRSSPASDERGQLLGSLGRLVRQMHSAGFWHPDLHTGNILLEPDASPPKIWFADLHSAGYSPRVSHRRRMADLAKLTFSLRDLLDEPQFRVLLAAYAPDAAEAEIKSMLMRLLTTADSLHKRRVKTRSKRCLKTSGKFVVERIGDKKLYRRREFSSDAILGAVDRHKEIRASGGSELVKSTSKTALTAFRLSEETPERVYVKEFANRGFIRFMETTFYVHRGKRAWKASHLLRRLEVPCAEPVALVEERMFGLPHTSFLLMKEIPDATRLNVFLLRAYFRVSGRLSREEIQQKRELIREGALALREFHAKQIYHKDLSAKNLLVGHTNSGGLRFYCVDTDSIQFPRRLSLRRRIKNLAQLNGLPACITTADRVSFYKEYFGLQRLTLKDKHVIRVIRQLSLPRMKHARRIDARLREKSAIDQKTYEDIASL